ncbi:hypothetical protein TSOC_008000 [Tetrabaena socialis]|uniref:Uncharacterized protein n=1 Tax=Tetrabaena socialis TaxID=47790 RepID=A0A2J7ZZK7_9CHLO|nr:hypothetical protein TSOC_008000 [Tetrabaena socialis]|eukprot:PNH05701.1 hypothetical protein TSOC_008000 [Tetrabaena socialis]
MAPPRSPAVSGSPPPLTPKAPSLTAPAVRAGELWWCMVRAVASLAYGSGDASGGCKLVDNRIGANRQLRTTTQPSPMHRVAPTSMSECQLPYRDAVPRCRAALPTSPRAFRSD